MGVPYTVGDPPSDPYAAGDPPSDPYAAGDPPNGGSSAINGAVGARRGYGYVDVGMTEGAAGASYDVTEDLKKADYSVVKEKISREYKARPKS
jgi:hypothetical protein